MDVAANRVRAPRSVVTMALALALTAAACSSGGGSDASPSTEVVTVPTTTTAAADAPRAADDRPAMRLDLQEVDADGAPANLRQGLRPLPSAPTKGPVRVGGSAPAKWTRIDRSPPKPKAPRAETTVGPDGTRTESFPTCPQCGVTTSGPDGSWDIKYPNGDVASGGPGKDLRFSRTDPDGTTHLLDMGDGASVDVPAPTYPPGPAEPRGKEPSGAVGEPHYRSEDGTAVTSQVLGEFLLSTGVDGQEVQARTEPWQRSPRAAAISALAFGIDDQSVEVHADGTVLVDGKPAPDGTAQQLGFADGGAVGVWRDEAGGPATNVVVVWPDLSVAWVAPRAGSWLDLTLQWRQATGDRSGVLGSDDDEPANDLTQRDGTVVEEADVDDFVRSWQLTDDESLFAYADGLSTRSYVDDDFPADGPAPDLDAGAEACGEVPEGFARDACTFDVGLTGVEDWVESSKDVGERLAGYDALRESFDELAAALGVTGPTTDPSEPRLADGITLSAPDRAGASDVTEALAAAADLEGGGSSATFSFRLTDPSELTAQSNLLSCPNAAYEAGKAAYAFFDSEGKVVSGPRLACDDDPDAAVLEAGTYYVKLVGPGPVDIRIVLFTAD